MKKKKDQKIDQHSIAFQFSPDAIAITKSPEGNYIDVNDGFTELTGFSREAVLGKTPGEIGIWGNPEDMQKFLEIIEKEGGILNFEAKFRMQSGILKTCLISAKLIDIKGKPHILSVTRDIDDIKRTERKLLEQTQRQALILETARQLTAALDVKSVFRQIAIRSKKLLDAYSCDVYLLQDDKQSLKPVVTIDPDYKDEILSTTIRVGSSFSGQAVKKRKTLIFNDALNNPLGSQIPGTSVEEQERVIVSPIIIDGDVHGVLCLNKIGTNFTEDDRNLVEMFAMQASSALKNALIYDALQKEVNERKAAEAELKSYKDHLEDLVEKRTHELNRSREALRQERDIFIGGDVVIFKWKDKISSPVEYVSPNVKKIFGYKPVKFLSGELLYSDVVLKSDRAQLKFELKKALKKKAHKITHQPYRVRKKDKSIIWLQDFTTLIRDKHGKISHQVGYVVDITDKVQAEEELKEKQTQLAHAGRLSSLGEMATGVAHEINQPLSIIRVQAEVMRFAAKKGTLNYSEIAEDVEEIMEQVDRASTIIDRMREFARVEVKSESRIDLREPLNSSLAFFREQFKNHNIVLETDFRANLPKVKVNHHSFEQIVVNFMTNARYAVDKRKETAGPNYIKHVLLSTRYDEKEKNVIFEVRDNGIGMTKEERTRCLEPFFTVKDVADGTGLGLSIVHSIVKEFAGTIEIISKKNSGTTMRVLIPVNSKPPTKKKSVIKGPQ